MPSTKQLSREFEMLPEDEHVAFIANFDADENAPAADPTEAKPGSVDKVQMLAARYAAGLPLWHNEDCNDHGPGEDLEEEKPSPPNFFAAMV